ncbi:DUF2254 domain-containing protein [Halobacillus sp. A5]|uniref:DUF2254 domain-containing protein n=1 Tax=Halobacillus sp. A5 TaxID=2880263 RepID=UPI0020A6D79B|nr:DUF2254 domain-containing protein [Halobacillus sp. A5]MCP3029156.1 DUF2254 domain-containing protein [Halobacillus sp. A5]
MKKKKWMNFFPLEIRKYLQMSHRQRKNELQMTLWSMPLIYIGASTAIIVFTIFLDLQLNISNFVHPWFTAGGDATQILVSALIGGILTLSAFTLNSLLVVLTNFSDQFSPRMMFNFIADKTTQHLLGIFHGSFIYVLFIFLFLTNNENELYSAIPVMSVMLAALTIITFIFFINHAASWMQVHNFTYAMKNTSKSTIKESQKYGFEESSRQEAGDLMEKYAEGEMSVKTSEAGYLQTVYFKKMINQADKDNIVIKMHKKIGDFTLKENVLFSYWGPGQSSVNEDTYMDLIEIGHKKTEIQEMKMGIMKLSEIAVKAVGNSDPQTAISTIHHISDLLADVESKVAFSPYLHDQNKQTRIIVPREDFEYFLHTGFSTIRNAATGHLTIITELIAVMGMLAQTIGSDKHATLWDFAENTTEQVFENHIYDLDKKYFLEKLHELAVFTDNEKSYRAIEYNVKRTSSN